MALAAGGLALLLAGCATTSDLPATEARIVNPVDAMIIPPPGGPAILTVVSSTLPNAIRQEISLATDARTAGENKISVIQFTGEGGDGSDTRLQDVPFTNINLTEEALAAWPGSGMAVSPYYVQNAYGPFGYAIGKPANGDTCIYAWQRIAPTLRPSGAVARGTIVIRLQLCRRGATEQQLLEIMYKFRLDTSVFPPSRGNPAIGVIAAPIRPVGIDGFADVIDSGPRPTTVPRQTTPRVATPTPVANPIPTPPIGAPIVPSPSGGVPGQAGPTVPRPPTVSVTVPAPPTGSN